MVATSRQEVSNWSAVIAAMVYIAMFFGTCVGLYALATEGTFLDAFAMTFMQVFCAAVLFYVSGLILDACRRHKPGVHEHGPMSGRIDQSIELTHR